MIVLQKVYSKLCDTAKLKWDKFLFTGLIAQLIILFIIYFIYFYSLFNVVNYTNIKYLKSSQIWLLKIAKK